MTIHAPAALYRTAWAAPLLDLISDQLITPGELAERWRYTIPHITRLRTEGRPPTAIELPTGGIRYRLSHILDLELAGAKGPLTRQDVELAAACTPGLSDRDRHRAVEHLRMSVLHRGG